MTARTEPVSALEEKNAIILSLTDRNIALQQRVDQLAADLASADRLLERVRRQLTGIE
jgi:hypothetical protein